MNSTSKNGEKKSIAKYFYDFCYYSIIVLTIAFFAWLDMDYTDLLFISILIIGFGTTLVLIICDFFERLIWSDDWVVMLAKSILIGLVIFHVFVAIKSFVLWIV